jgi:urease accessory protein
LAEIVGADLGVMERDAARMRSVDLRFTDSREGGPTLFAQVKNGVGVDDVVRLILSAWRASGAAEKA